MTETMTVKLVFHAFTVFFLFNNPFIPGFYNCTFFENKADSYLKTVSVRGNTNFRAGSIVSG